MVVVDFDVVHLYTVVCIKVVVIFENNYLVVVLLNVVVSVWVVILHNTAPVI